MDSTGSLSPSERPPHQL